MSTENTNTNSDQKQAETVNPRKVKKQETIVLQPDPGLKGN